ncbi:cold-regulated protein 27-like [Typha latifolia]|uniref:cold-regulated protein 27-like n=1 Tax=Typha latifolia TaxID=4733 RepID=UPI003C30DA35
MEDGSLDRPMKSEIGGIEDEGNQVLDSIPNRWTDEKHMLYLSSMEASFVNQLYNSEHHSKDLLGWSPKTQKLTNLPRSDGNHLLQFKVLRKGCWENLKFERAKTRVDNGNESHPLHANPWIQHFRYKNAKNHQVDDFESDSQSIRREGQQHGKETKCSTELPTCHHTNHQDLIDRSTEVSDQNFVDEVVGGAESSRTSRKKRSRKPVANLLNDQVVPSGKSLSAPDSREDRDCLRGKDT